MFDWLKKKKKDNENENAELIESEAAGSSEDPESEASDLKEAAEASVSDQMPEQKPEPKAAAGQVNEPVKKKKPGFFSRFFSSMFESIDDDFYDELEEQLIIGDIGVYATEELLDNLKDEVRNNRSIKNSEDARNFLIADLKRIMAQPEDAYDFENKKSVVMLIGVNGVGKTTCVGKLARRYMDEGKKVIMAGADTFRAAAMDQLKIWAERTGCYMVSGNEGADPGSVVFDAARAANARGADIMLCDTAGRLHNKKNLMNELGKLDKILSGEAPDYTRENLIVLDATTGQNALQQAREFSEVMKIDGIVLTKLDGTAKGGIAVAITRELGVPVKYIGVGEGVGDLQRFDPDDYVESLFAE